MSPLKFPLTLAIAILANLLAIAYCACASEKSSPLDGHWRLVQTEREAEERLRAIDEVIRHMRPFQQGKARSRLVERTSPPPVLSISTADSVVSITYGTDHINLDLGGPPVEVSGKGGRAFVTAMMEGSLLVIIARNGGGVRKTNYQVVNDRLRVEATLSDARLPKTLTYVSIYKTTE